MSKRSIVLNIDNNGNMSAETFDMQGTECIAELNKLMRSMATVTSENKKPEYYKGKARISATQKVKSDNILQN